MDRYQLRILKRTFKVEEDIDKTTEQVPAQDEVLLNIHEPKIEIKVEDTELDLSVDDEVPDILEPNIEIKEEDAEVFISSYGESSEETPDSKVAEERSIAKTKESMRSDNSFISDNKADGTPSKVKTRKKKEIVSDADRVSPRSYYYFDSVTFLKCTKERRSKYPLLLSCKECNVAFSCKRNAISHMKTDHKIHFYICTLCKNSYLSVKDVEEHIRNDHLYKTKPYRCDRCSYRSFFNSLLQRHITMYHMTGDLFKCQYCPYKSSFKQNYNAHMSRTHGDKKEIISKVLSSMVPLI